MLQEWNNDVAQNYAFYHHIDDHINTKHFHFPFCQNFTFPFSLFDLIYFILRLNSIQFILLSRCSHVSLVHIFFMTIFDFFFIALTILYLIVSQRASLFNWEGRVLVLAKRYHATLPLCKVRHTIHVTSVDFFVSPFSGWFVFAIQVVMFLSCDHTRSRCLSKHREICMD